MIERRYIHFQNIMRPKIGSKPHSRYCNFVNTFGFMTINNNKTTLPIKSILSIIYFYSYGDDAPDSFLTVFLILVIIIIVLSAYIFEKYILLIQIHFISIHPIMTVYKCVLFFYIGF